MDLPTLTMAPVAPRSLAICKKSCPSNVIPSKATKSPFSPMVRVSVDTSAKVIELVPVYCPCVASSTSCTVNCAILSLL